MGRIRVNICLSGAFLILKSNRGRNPAAWLDSGISKSWDLFRGEIAVYALSFIAFDKPSHVLRYHAQGSPPQPKAQ